MDNDDFFIDDLSGGDGKKRKKIKSGVKGKRSERNVVNILNSRFSSILDSNKDWGKFSRSVGSGNRHGQKVALPSQIEHVFASDIVPPTNFKFSIESKSGYNDIDLCSAFINGHRKLDNFLKQVFEDAQRVKREPLLIWKKDRKDYLVFFLSPKDLVEKIQYRMIYREWTIISLEKLLEFPDSLFFTGDKCQN